MFKALPTSPTQEMTNLHIDTETPKRTRIEFIFCDDDVKCIQRPMPENLRGVLTENDFESFCDKVDMLLDIYHESASLLGSRFFRLVLIVLFLFAGIIFLTMLPPSANALVNFIYPVLVSCIPVTGIAMFAVLGKHVYDKAALNKQTHAECLQLTNRTGNATFRLETKMIKPEYSENWVSVFSHINVLISDTVQPKDNVTNDDTMKSEIC